MNLRVNEIYGPVAQGEGRNIGQLCFFLRVAGCNLSCAWKGSGCDTFYTWNYKGTSFKNEDQFAPWMKKVRMEDEVKEMDFLDVYAQLTELKDKHQLARLVVSGGEPLVQQNALAPLLEKLKADGWYIELETNGTFQPLPRFDFSVDQYNVSPKLKSSGNIDALRIQRSVLKWFGANPRTIFKFVVASKEDVDEVDKIVMDAQADMDKVYLMPVGHDRKELEANEEKVYTWAVQKGYGYSTRLHIHIFDIKRAV